MALYGPHAAVNFGHATANANAAALDGDAGMRALRKLWLTHHPRWRERETTHGTVQEGVIKEGVGQAEAP